MPLRPINASFFYPDVPVFDTREVAGPTNLLISNADLGRALARSLANNTVILLRGHGNAVVGPNIRLAVYRAIYTELNARLLLNSITLGGPVNYLSSDEAALIEQSMNTHRPGHGWDRNWEVWATEAMAASALKP
jgi:HCOMODA/2-hydroxy-3-carboxy-muconic semialdehyde decarboxylase